MNLTPFFRMVLLLGLLVAGSAQAASPQPPLLPITQFNIVLLQPSAVLEERVADVDAMAAYVKALGAAAGEAVLASGAQQSVGGFIVVAVRPGGQARVWLDFDAMLDLELKRQITSRLKAVQPFEAHKGPVVFALKVATWSGKESKRLAPAPLEWKAARQAGAPLEVGSLVESLWAD
ncbi:hypothetical protein [Roseateles albus]|uniref:Uncharacterized protein n=1 Tax=Roseateles albus TaxID=2987525 RepID=A0ABT5KBE2_9BURK|nr:hypothetical protein [Roseateles albus]MDC8771203.1 hypothetical protein [Roseateles albus]